MLISVGLLVLLQLTKVTDRRTNRWMYGRLATILLASEIREIRLKY
jgi:hypothetical protein